MVLVEPLDFGSNKISVLCKPEMGSTIGHLLATSRCKDDSCLRFLMHQEICSGKRSGVVRGLSQIKMLPDLLARLSKYMNLTIFLIVFRLPSTVVSRL